MDGREQTLAIQEVKTVALSLHPLLLGKRRRGLKRLGNSQTRKHQNLENLEMFKGYVTRMINDGYISYDVFFGRNQFHRVVERIRATSLL